MQSGSLYEVIEYAYNLHSASPPSGFICMTMDTWNSLPPEIQLVFEDNFSWAVDMVTEILMDSDQESIDFAIENGVQLSELSSEDLNNIYGYMDEIALEKAAEIDAQGLPGTEIYTELKRLKEEIIAAR